MIPLALAACLPETRLPEGDASYLAFCDAGVGWKIPRDIAKRLRERGLIDGAGRWTAAGRELWAREYRHG